MSHYSCYINLFFNWQNINYSCVSRKNEKHSGDKMEPDASNTSPDLMRSNSDDDHQSSDERETHDGNNVDNNAESKETEPEPAGPCPHIIHTNSQCNADSSYTVTCTVRMVLAVPRGAGTY